MTAAELKASILDLAIRGKLVAQDPNDEPASELLARIAAEKAKHATNGRGRTPAAPPPITDDDKPFEIPAGWSWCRIGQLCEKVVDCPHCTPIKASKPTLYPCIRTSEIKGGTLRWDTMQYVEEDEYKKRVERLVPEPDDLVYAREGSFGDAVLLPKGPMFCLGQRTMLFRVFKGEVYPKFVLQAVISPVVYAQAVALNVAGTTSVPHVNVGDAINFVIPLPPIAEQKRIVAKVEELLPLVERYEKAEAKRIELERALPGDLEKSILQEAIQGKLVEQDPDDEPASELLARIAAEKAKLIKEKKLKKEKPLAPITEDEKSFELPKGWAWCRLGDACDIVMGQSPDGSSINKKDGIEFHQGKIFFTGYEIAISSEKTTTPTKIVPSGSVLLCVRAPVGKVNVTRRKICIGRGLCAVIPKDEMLSRFVFLWLSTCEEIFNSKATGSTFKAISKDIVMDQVIPLPPLAEQKRIVAKVDELLGAIRRLH